MERRLPKGTAAEGEATMIVSKGTVADVLHELSGGLRSGMTYLGADSMDKMPELGLLWK